jgi:hypothetical protein
MWAITRQKGPAVDLAFLLTSITTVAALVWAGVAYVVFGWTDRWTGIRTPVANAVILLGGGFVAPVVVLATLLALALPLVGGAPRFAESEYVLHQE